ncbi:pentapeptide repeat-containing protein [Mesorhizobium sp. B2-8-5]|uniref:pentapeptide repeat-containing protein n=1 Tax=Mesorhizobium sp. B2-8-5 TaxID=2589903 RepID=UPI00112D6A2E|nr:pentapeptide repeat-containing protein [Mesorhizobium sp. B2-8-5]UCI28427.1 pentapeptide repeat-containing protein [Mesorhizobium sp. B2-8-5]
MVVELDEVLAKVHSADTDNFVELVRISGLDPASDFRFANFEGMDFSNCKLRGFDFTGCDFTKANIGNANFSGAVTKGAKFTNNSSSPDRIRTQALIQKRREIVTAMSSRLGDTLIQTSQAMYQNADGKKRIACTISKRYDGRTPYWYAYHPKWDDFLRDASDGYFVLGCLDLKIAFSIPRLVVNRLLIDLHASKTKTSQYWHVHIGEPAEGEYVLIIPHKKTVSLKPYEFLI